MDDISLIPVTAENWEQVCALNPGAAGRAFVASNAYSIAQSVFEPGWHIWGIARGEVLIGFAMYGYAEDLKGDELCRFMLDQRYQGRGWGQRALRVVLDEMCRGGGCRRIYLSTDPANAIGKHVYEKAGFVPTGETCGEGDDLEELFCLTI